MMLPLVLIGLLLTLCVYIIVAPFYLEINTTEDLYRIRFHKLASLSLHLQAEPVLLLKIAGWKRAISIEQRPAVKEVAIKKQIPRSQRKRSGLSYAQVKRVLQSFKIKTLHLDLDSGDMPLNGILFPFFYWLSKYSGKGFHINFTGNTVLILVVKNSIARMGWALISSKLKTNPS